MILNNFIITKAMFSFFLFVIHSHRYNTLVLENISSIQFLYLFVKIQTFIHLVISNVSLWQYCEYENSLVSYKNFIYCKYRKLYKTK